MSLQEQISRHHFFHTIELAPGITTGGVPWAKEFQDNFSEATKTIDFRNKSVLDVGCRDGAMLLKAEERGASELLGVDNDISTGLVDVIIPHFESKIKTKQANLYDLTPENTGQFDIVIAAGLIYHLIYPIYGLRKLSSLLKPGGKLIIETGIMDAFPGIPLLLFTFGNQSPYEGSSPAFFNFDCLESAHLTVGMTNPKILRQFNKHTYEWAKKFPNYKPPLMAPKKFSIYRTITLSERKDVDIHYAHYFERTHQMHSTGTDR